MSRVIDKIIRIHAAYKGVFGEAMGRRVLLHLCRKFFVTKPAFHQDPQIAAFREGQRSVVLAILNYINKDEAQLANLIESATREDEG